MWITLHRLLLLLNTDTKWLHSKSLVVTFLVCFQNHTLQSGCYLSTSDYVCFRNRARKTLRCHDLSLDPSLINPRCGLLVYFSHHMTFISLIQKPRFIFRVMVESFSRWDFQSHINILQKKEQLVLDMWNAKRKVAQFMKAVNGQGRDHRDFIFLELSWAIDFYPCRSELQSH